MKIKVGDTVVVISGSRTDKKKTGKVLQTFKDNDTIVVEGVNLKKKVSRDANGTKSTVDVEYPIHVSQVMFYDEKAKAGSRLGYQGAGKEKTRITKKSGTTLK
jgi:large subunit ribosomal protein L24